MDDSLVDWLFGFDVNRLDNLTVNNGLNFLDDSGTNAFADDWIFAHGDLLDTLIFGDQSARGVHLSLTLIAVIVVRASIVRYSTFNSDKLVLLFFVVELNDVLYRLNDLADFGCVTIAIHNIGDIFVLFANPLFIDDCRSLFTDVNIGSFGIGSVSRNAGSSRYDVIRGDLSLEVTSGTSNISVVLDGD